MRKCPNCAEENINESLFCKHCGRCLLAPDPEKGQWSIAMHTEHHTTREGIGFYVGNVVNKSSVARIRRRHQTGPSVIGGWLLLLNLLVIFLMFEIAYIVTK
jgi:hypothetical protein